MGDQNILDYGGWWSNTLPIAQTYIMPFIRILSLKNTVWYAIQDMTPY